LKASAEVEKVVAEGGRAIFGGGGGKDVRLAVKVVDYGIERLYEDGELHNVRGGSIQNYSLQQMAFR
jgi:hypothetical protein